MRLGQVLAHLEALETELATRLAAAAGEHREEHDVYHQCHTFALAARQRATAIGPFSTQYAGVAEWTSAAGAGRGMLLEDLRALFLGVQEAAVTWIMVVQAAKALRDAELLAVATECHGAAAMQARWFETRIKTAAPQALVVPA